MSALVQIQTAKILSDSQQPQLFESGPKPRASHQAVAQAPVFGSLAGDVGRGAGARVGCGVGLKRVG